MRDEKPPELKKVGRPPKINPKIMEKILNAIRAGNYMETAAAYAGIDKVTLYSWMKKGNQQPRSVYGQFLNALSEAQAQSQIRDVMNIDLAAMGRKNVYERDANGKLVFDGNGDPIVIEYGFKPNWQASAWRLERKYPKLWGKQDSMDITTQGKEINPSMPVQQVVIQLPPKDEE